MREYTIIEIGTGYVIAPKMALYPQEVKAIEKAGFICKPFEGVKDKYLTA